MELGGRGLKEEIGADVESGGEALGLGLADGAFAVEDFGDTAPGAEDGDSEN